MSVGHHDLLYDEVVFLKDGENGLDLITRINDDGFSGCLVAHDGAVALERTNGKNFVDASPAQQTAMLDLIAYRKNASPELNPDFKAGKDL